MRSWSLEGTRKGLEATAKMKSYTETRARGEERQLKRRAGECGGRCRRFAKAFVRERDGG